MNKSKWNRRILDSNSDIYNEFDYLNAVTKSNWYGFVWADYDKVLPFYQKKKWGFIPYICMPAFCQKFDNLRLNVNEFNDAINYLRKRNFSIDCSLSISYGWIDFEERDNFSLDLKSRDYEEVYKEYSSLLKKNIAKASSSLSLSSDENIETVLSFLNSNDLFQKLVLKKHRIVFENLIHSIPRKIVSAKKDGKIVAVLIAFVFHKKAYLVFPYMNELGRKHQAMSFLIDVLVKSGDFEVIDFEGSTIPSIAIFYEQFGAKKEAYAYYSYRRF